MFLKAFWIGLRVREAWGLAGEAYPSQPNQRADWLYPALIASALLMVFLLGYGVGLGVATYQLHEALEGAERGSENE
jgi:hypothetical protein